MAARRSTRQRGPKKAITAVAASILTAIYHMLKDGTMYKDLGLVPSGDRHMTSIVSPTAISPALTTSE